MGHTGFGLENPTGNVQQDNEAEPGEYEGSWDESAAAAEVHAWHGRGGGAIAEKERLSKQD